MFLSCKINHKSFLKFHSFSISAGQQKIRRAVTTEPKYVIRMATAKDITLIDDCNRMTLPENYDYDFFKQHLEDFPTLSLVAVQRLTLNLNNNGHRNRLPSPVIPPSIMGYLLAKCDDRLGHITRCVYRQ
jgi:hypothetical protein